MKEDEEDDESYDGDGGGEVANVHRGYLGRLLSAMLSCVFLLVATGPALVLCFLYVLGTFVLWALGIYRIIGKWMRLSLNERGRKTPEAMPGLADGCTWDRAWEFASRWNHGVSEIRGYAHFNVAQFLKSNTGMNLHHLASVVKARDAKSKSEKEGIEADCNSLDSVLEHLFERINRRAKMKQEEPTSTPIPADSAYGGSGRGGSISHTDPPPQPAASSAGFCCCCDGAESPGAPTVGEVASGDGVEENAHAPRC